MATSSDLNPPALRSWWLIDVPAAPPPITTILWFRTALETGLGAIVANERDFGEMAERRLGAAEANRIMVALQCVAYCNFAVSPRTSFLSLGSAIGKQSCVVNLT